MIDERERRAAFRAWVRAHHPDVGGDPETFAAELRRRRAGGGRRDARERRYGPVVVVRRRPGLGLLERWLERRRRRGARDLK
ncbi:hypothetical protein SAMN04489712_102413 [Thermomonospora echinospora]|uniref:DnaJ domain-containing protein n=1 Tax=Thermomonospora echinospora TaxID=1992 RepID=A0A1H5VQ27_9ACTN|nr:hypothetical protein [Thermomonospora echinospora]SEF89412.1 hypothetical protein SAMN04489712_102413 [Thermomonospora echinospora]